MREIDSIALQWKKVLLHPHLRDCAGLKETIKKLAVISNAEVGYEQSNRKYNLMKNDLSHRMKIPMIKARMRAGTNGPPLHLFSAKMILQHWKANGHRLALKVDSHAIDESHVLKRIRKDAAMKYTCDLFTK